MTDEPNTRLHELFDHLRQAVSILGQLLSGPAAVTTAAPRNVQVEPPQQERPSPAILSKLAYSIKEVCKLTGIGRSLLYLGINRGSLRAVKRGKRTLILSADLRAWIAKLPPSR